MSEPTRLDVLAAQCYIVPVAAVTGKVLDAAMPQYRPQEDFGPTCGLLAAQFAVGTLALHEIFRALISGDSGSPPPVSDAAALWFFYQLQPQFQLRLNAVASKLGSELDDLMHKGRRPGSSSEIRDVTPALKKRRKTQQ
jgi:hypothetical protein